MCEACEERFPRLSRRGVILALGASFAASTAPAALASTASAFLAQQPLAVFHPPGFDFGESSESIEEEWQELEEYYQAYFTAMVGGPPRSAYGLAIANQVIGFVRNDPSYIARAGGLYALHRDATENAKEKRLAALGAEYCGYVLSGNYPKSTRTEPAVAPTVYEKVTGPTGAFSKIILGRSTIHVTADTLVKTQVDRVTRDWLLAFQPQGVPWKSESGKLFFSHEGARVSDIVAYSGARMTPVWGMQAERIGEKWYAPDQSGVPKFEISPDKVREYPSGIVVDDHTAIVNDTHGISAIAWDAADATLVVGCGDHKGKMDAAYYLASRGTDVYVPTDRLLGLLIGAKTKGTIIGSAPVKNTSKGAEIGNQPVTIDVDELIVVSNAIPQYPLQYYDTPLRYFTLLGEFIGRKLNLKDVLVEEYGYAVPVVETAQDLGARVIGIRVKSAKEHAAVAAWLREDQRHRAILFHTAAYADGYQLFAEFPNQTSFGDIHPKFA